MISPNALLYLGRNYLFCDMVCILRFQLLQRLFCIWVETIFFVTWYAFYASIFIERDNFCFSLNSDDRSSVSFQRASFVGQVYHNRSNYRSSNASNYSSDNCYQGKVGGRRAAVCRLNSWCWRRRCRVCKNKYRLG